MSKFGCINETPSVRTYNYEAVCGASKTSLPESYMIPEDALPKVKNQGSIGACVAFALSEILSVFNKMEFGELKDFSEGFIYGFNRNSDSRASGMLPQTTLDYMRKQGSVPKEYYNELYEMPDMRTKIMENPNLEKLKEIAEKYKIAGYVGFLKGEREEMKRAIYEKNIPLFGISSTYFGEGHAVIVIGWNKDGFIIQNSWGESWKENGRGTVPLSAINYAYLITDEEFDLTFKDVKKEAWYYKPIKEAVFNGFMNGMSQDEFAPEGYLTRAQAAQLIVNTQKKNDEIIKMQANRIEVLEEMVRKIQLKI